MDRRQVLDVLKGSALAAAAWPLIREKPAHATPSSRPRFYLHIIPQGGMDAVYSTDPKKISEVDTGIDVPFGPGEIVETTGGGRLGPSFRALARWTPRLAIVNAFRQNSANHLSGLSNVMHCKSRSAPGSPTLMEILGGRRQREATGAISIGAAMPSAFTPAYLGEPGTLPFGNRPGLFEHLDKADPDGLVGAAKALRREAQLLGGARASAAQRTTAENLRSSAELFARVAVTPKFAPVDWGAEGKDSYRGVGPSENVYHNGRDLQRVLWLFEHGLTRCVTLCVGNQDFDSHIWNAAGQTILVEYLALLLDRLFMELDRRMVDGRPLSEQTVVIVGSEIGRFPRLNGARGKDHFPQSPHLFYGPGLVTGATYGATGRDMAGLPISLATGRPAPGGHLLRVDDIGTTLLALDGANPELYGYTGKHLTFLTGT
ncbi:MAG: hypothetical protein H6Q90_3736 [Deltaproteobacteria bacterium]|nr:hypothetical protein [Deltaproteobacteria bacterium]